MPFFGGRRGHREFLRHGQHQVRLAKSPFGRKLARRRCVLGITLRTTLVYPGQQRIAVLGFQTAVVGELAVLRIGVPRRHSPFTHHFADGLRPGGGIVVIQQRHRADLSGAMTFLAVFLQDAGYLLRVGHRAVGSRGSGKTESWDPPDHPRRCRRPTGWGAIFARLVGADVIVDRELGDRHWSASRCRRACPRRGDRKDRDAGHRQERAPSRLSMVLDAAAGRAIGADTRRGMAIIDLLAGPHMAKRIHMGGGPMRRDDQRIVGQSAPAGRQFDPGLVIGAIDRHEMLRQRSPFQMGHRFARHCWRSSP